MKNYQIKGEDGKMYWVHRAITVVGVVFKIDRENEKVFVLANKRGKGTPDFQGLWNVPCGYVDFDETLTEACAREVKEETGYDFNPDLFNIFGINDNPEENRQNITARFFAMVESDDMPAQEVLDGEDDEVEEVKWILLEEINNYKWAFNHDRVIKAAFDFIVNS